MKPRYDVVVVGSGYGGGVAALRSAQSTSRDGEPLDVCILERGREFAPGEFPEEETSFLRELNTTQIVAGDASPRGGSQQEETKGQTSPEPGAPASRPSRPYPELKPGRGGDSGKLFDYYELGGLDALVGNGLGGTSLINAAVAMWPERSVFEANKGWPEHFRVPENYAALQAAKERAEQELGVVAYAGAKHLPKHKAHDKYFNGHRKVPTPLSIPSLDSAAADPLGLEQCVQCGDCTTGCNYGAKATVAETYIRKAVSAGAAVFTEVKVRRVERMRSGTWRVYFTPIVSEPAAAITDYIETDLVVLAAGVLGTTRILDASRTDSADVAEAPRPRVRLHCDEFNPNSRLGRGFSANGDMLALAYNARIRSKAVGAGAASPQFVGQVGPTATSTYRIDRLGAQVQDGVIPGVFAMAQRLLPWRSRRKSTGPGLRRKLMTILLGAHRGAADNTHVFLSMGHDGELHDLDLKGWGAYPRLKSKPKSEWYNELERELRTIAERQGATYLSGAQVLSGLTKERLTVHPLGGCGMGDDGSSGVTDYLGRVFARDSGTEYYRGLVVADGSLIPNSLGVNPFLTIAALAEYAMPQIIREVFGASEPAQDRDLCPRSSVPKDPFGPSLTFTETMRGKICPVGDHGKPSCAVPVRMLAKISLRPIFLTVGQEIQGGIMTSALSGVNEFWRFESDARLVVLQPVEVPEDISQAIQTQMQGRFRMVYSGTARSRRGETVRFEISKDLMGLGAELLPDLFGSTRGFIRISPCGEPSEDIAVGRLRLDPEDLLGIINTMRVEPSSPLQQLLWVRAAYLSAKRALEVQASQGPDQGGFLGTCLQVDPEFHTVEAAVLDGLSRAMPAQVAPEPTKERRQGSVRLHLRETWKEPEYLSQRNAKHGISEDWTVEYLSDNLRLLRLGRGNTESPMGPVILAPGFGVSSRSLHPLTAKKTLASTLGARGYDVWLMDYRASPDLAGSRQPFLLEDVAVEDWPMAVRHVVAETARKPKVFAHCLGAYTLLWAAGVDTGVRENIRGIVCSQVGLFLPAGWLNLFKALVTHALGPRGVSKLQKQLLGDEKIDPHQAVEILRLPPELDTYARVCAEVWGPALADGEVAMADAKKFADWSHVQDVISAQLGAYADTPDLGRLIVEPNGYNVASRVFRALTTAFRASIVLTHRSVLREFFMPDPAAMSTNPSVNPLDDFLGELPIVGGERHADPGLRRIFGIFGPAVCVDNLSAEALRELNDMFGEIHVEALRDVSSHLVKGGLSFETARSRGYSGMPASRTLESNYLASLRSLTMPLAFVHGAKNRTFLPQGIEDTLVMLRGLDSRIQPVSIEFPEFGHMDCYLSEDPSAGKAFTAIADLLDGF